MKTRRNEPKDDSWPLDGSEIGSILWRYVSLNSISVVLFMVAMPMGIKNPGFAIWLVFFNGALLIKDYARLSLRKKRAKEHHREEEVGGLSQLVLFIKKVSLLAGVLVVVYGGLVVVRCDSSVALAVAVAVSMVFDDVRSARPSAAARWPNNDKKGK